jgi:hypothetical protein
MGGHCSGHWGGIALDPAGRQRQVPGARERRLAYGIGAEVTEPGVIRQDGKGAALPSASQTARARTVWRLARGRPLEIDMLACCIAEMRSLVGLTMPTIDMIFDRALLGIREVRLQRQRRQCRRIDATPRPTLGIAVQQSSGVS